MPEDVTATPTTTQDGGAPLVPGGTGGAPAAAPDAAAAAAAATQPNGSTINLPQSAMKRIKEEQYQKGQQEALQQLAQSLGYSSVEEMQQLAKKPTPAPKPAPAAAATAQPDADLPATDPAAAARDQKNEARALARYERQLEQLRRESDSYKTKYQTSETRAKQLEEELSARTAEIGLREIAVATGVKDVDYALRLLSKELDGKPTAELEKFDERGFFENLRKTKPYLFGEVVQPATTGPGVTTPTAPKPGAASAAAAAAGAIDARKMTQQEYQEHLRKRGLNPQH